MERKNLNIDAELKAVKEDGDIGYIQGYGSVFGNVDSYGDIVVKGSFVKSIEKKMPALLLQHNPADVVGVWKVAKEDKNGLYLEGELNLKVQKARENYELLKQGALKGMSIGFSTVDSEYNQEGKRLIKEVDLWEVSIVTFPANVAAQINGVKSLEQISKRELEAILRDAGLSISQAKAFIAEGYKAIDSQRDVENQIAEGLKSILSTLSKGK
jgi:HK97 family phage prohead protease